MSLQNKTIAFLGAGNMAEALIRGLFAKQVLPPARVIATDVHAERRDYMHRTFGIVMSTDNLAAVRQADIIILAVKPQQMSALLAELRPAMDGRKLIVSIAAGITTARLERELGGTTRVVRVMPNTPALVGAGAAALCSGKFTTAADMATAESILHAVGIVVTVDEKDIDAVTALSGSGPAYMFFVTEAMIKAGIEQGLTPDIARKLAIQTILGSALLLTESQEEPAALRRKVTSPGGTTEAAIKTMTEGKLPELFASAMAAASKRSKELSGQ